MTLHAEFALMVNLTTVFWGLFTPRRALIVPNFVIGCILLLLILVILCITEVIRTDIQFSCPIICFVIALGSD